MPATVTFCATKMEAPFTANQANITILSEKVCNLFSALCCGSASRKASDLQNGKARTIQYNKNSLYRTQWSTVDSNLRCGQSLRGQRRLETQGANFQYKNLAYLPENWHVKQKSEDNAMISMISRLNETKLYHKHSHCWHSKYNMHWKRTRYYVKSFSKLRGA